MFSLHFLDNQTEYTRLEKGNKYNKFIQKKKKQNLPEND